MRALIKTISLRAVIRCEGGASTVEYALILAFIFLAMIAALQGVADQTIGMWGHVANEVNAH